MSLNSADLEPQIISNQLIEIIEYAFCVMMISEMNSIMFYGVNILILVENYIYGLLSYFSIDHIHRYLEAQMHILSGTIIYKYCR